MTNQKFVKLAYLWTISNFSLCQQRTGQALLSSAFSGGNNEPVTWRVKLFPRGSDEYYEQFVSVFLVSCNTRCVSARVRFSIIDAQEQVAIRKCTETRTFMSKGDGWGFGILVARLALKQNSSNLLPNDMLTLKCEVVALESSTTSAPRRSSEMALPALPECRLSDDLAWLLESGSSADVTLTVGSETFHAHKNILAARSPVFRDMFKHTTTEDDNVVIADVEPDVFANILQFVYTGSVPEPIEKPDSLLRAADRYHLDRLKAMCELTLISRLSAETASDTLILSHQHDADTLRSRTLNFVYSHIDDVAETSGWSTICKSHVELLEQLLMTFINMRGEPPSKRSRTL
ncbi:speckle-type POZ protein B [Rhipicephalus sanguineus]|nr:speckle-type POZ protein B [Rhipicephalus sanguineus]